MTPNPQGPQSALSQGPHPHIWEDAEACLPPPSASPEFLLRFLLPVSISPIHCLLLQGPRLLLHDDLSPISPIALLILDQPSCFPARAA